MRDENTRETAIAELQRLVQAELEQAVLLQNRLEQGAQLWNTPGIYRPVDLCGGRGHGCRQRCTGFFSLGD